MFQGRHKALTFSYDDGVEQDVRLIELFDRYAMKATFNLNSGLLGQKRTLIRNDVPVRHDKIAPEKVRACYQNHEVAAHTVTHPNLTALSDAQVLAQVRDDQAALSALCGYDVCGMAYPGGGVNYNAHVAALIARHTSLRYCRTTVCTGGFAPEQDLSQLRPTVYHLDIDEMFRLGEQFLRLDAKTDQIFYVWGHSYEFDAWDFWDRFEDFLRLMHGRDDIFYGTNRQVLLGMA